METALLHLKLRTRKLLYRLRVCAMLLVQQSAGDFDQFYYVIWLPGLL
jgi:hypothetical protein